MPAKPKFTLLINPAQPSRIGTSVARDTNPDLTFAMLPEGGTAKWRNTGINLGSDHFIIEIELPLAHLNGNPNRDKTIKHKLVDWSKFRNTELGEVDNIDEWSAKLLAATEGATEEIDAPEGIETMDPRLAHLLEARRSLQKRWRRQRHNRKLRKKIAELGREIERHSRQLCSQQWFALCSQADGQLHRGGTWKLLRQLMDETKSCEYQPRKIIVYPLPKNMDPERDAGRRAARAVALARQHQRDEGAVYVDAARYSGRRNAFAAVVVSATTGKLLTASTVRARTAGQAEEAAIALATAEFLVVKFQVAESQVVEFPVVEFLVVEFLVVEFLVVKSLVLQFLVVEFLDMEFLVAESVFVEFVVVEFLVVESLVAEFLVAEFLVVEFLVVEFLVEEFQVVAFLVVEFLVLEFLVVEFLVVESPVAVFLVAEFLVWEFPVAEFLVVESQVVEFKLVEFQVVEYIVVEFLVVDFLVVEYLVVDFPVVEFLVVELRSL
ncbi:hypothetical protein MRX96_051801 [Rhipicephalus microplus]